MLDYRLVKAFAAVLEEGGFSRAAQRLCISQSAVSHQIKQLEDETGTMFIIRENPPRATPAGKRLLRHYRQVMELEDEAIADFALCKKGKEFRHIPIAVNSDSLSVWLMDAIVPFLFEESITLEIFVDDQDSNLRLLQTGAVAGCVSSQRMNIQGFTATRIGVMRHLLLASPTFCDKWFGEGFERTSAARAPVINFNRDDQLNYRSLLKVFGKPAISPPAHFIPSEVQFTEAIVRGLGYAMMPEALAMPWISKGAIVEIDPRGRLETSIYWYRWSQSSDMFQEFSKVLLAKGKLLLK